MLICTRWLASVIEMSGPTVINILPHHDQKQVRAALGKIVDEGFDYRVVICKGSVANDFDRELTARCTTGFMVGPPSSFDRLLCNISVLYNQRQDRHVSWTVLSTRGSIHDFMLGEIWRSYLDRHPDESHAPGRQLQRLDRVRDSMSLEINPFIYAMLVIPLTEGDQRLVRALSFVATHIGVFMRDANFAERVIDTSLSRLMYAILHLALQHLDSEQAFNQKDVVAALAIDATSSGGLLEGQPAWLQDQFRDISCSVDHYTKAKTAMVQVARDLGDTNRVPDFEDHVIAHAVEVGKEKGEEMSGRAAAAAGDAAQEQLEQAGQAAENNGGVMDVDYPVLNQVIADALSTSASAGPAAAAADTGMPNPADTAGPAADWVPPSAQREDEEDEADVAKTDGSPPQKRKPTRASQRNTQAKKPRKQ
jgi:hypothetical protein